ncbi:Mrp/NBP35 family ATP-binding protein [bacterium]|nr:Mrp/NBP35 family ATP-binding protein [bacterium]
MSTQQEQQAQQDQRIEENLKHIKHRIVIFSGKGGVGKSTVAVNLAYAMKNRNHKVGLMDADITGPNIPQMTGLTGSPKIHEDGKRFYPQEKNGVSIVSMASLMPPDTALIWRGPLRSTVITQFLGDVLWGELDHLLADLPPGTGDEVLTAAQRMKPQTAVVVTTPQDVSLADCRRAVTMAKKLEIPRIAVVENMSGLICPHCDKSIDIFDSGGGEKLALETGATFLGRIPMEIETRIGGDIGQPAVLHRPESATARAFEEIATQLASLIKS